MNRIKSFTSVAIITLVTTVLTVFSGCSKDEGLVPDAQMDEKEMLVFKDYEEYSSTLSKLESLEYEELVAWEEAQGFKSFERISNQIYWEEDFENYKSLNDFIDFVKSNNTFIEISNELGETVIDVKYYNNPRRYIMNANRMFQVSDSVYKVFKNGIAFTEKKNAELLKEVSDDEYSPSKSKDIRFIDSGVIKSEEGKWGVCYGGVDRATTGSERVRIEIYQDYKRFYSWDEVSVYAEIRPYKRNLGIWFWAERKITGNLSWKFHFNDFDYIVENKQWNSVLSRFERVKHTKDCPIGTVATFVGYDFYAKTNVTNNEYAVLQCNPGMIN